jgi:DNA-directed RNA polymerase subunit alpha
MQQELIAQNWRQLIRPRRLESEAESATPRYGRFWCEPLERGFGVTLGNALRRVLLSSLQGVAVTAARVNDERVRHEFTAIPGVQEDVTDIVLNLKQLRFRHLGDGPRRGVFAAKGPKVITGADLEISTDVSVLNPEQVVATVNKDGDFHLEVEVTSGKGYLPAEDQVGADQRAIGWINMDTLFSPVTRVNYLVENTRIGQRIDYDKLVLEIWTDTSILPMDALAMAGKILRDHFSLFVRFEEAFEEEREEVVDTEYLEIKSKLEKPVDELELSVRSANCLRAAKIRTLGELVMKSEAEMLQYRNFGKKSLKEISDLLAGMGLHFGMDVARYLGAQPGVAAGGELDLDLGEVGEDLENGDDVDAEI